MSPLRRKTTPPRMQTVRRSVGKNGPPPRVYELKTRPIEILNKEADVHVRTTPGEIHGTGGRDINLNIRIKGGGGRSARPMTPRSRGTRPVFEYVTATNNLFQRGELHDQFTKLMEVGTGNIKQLQQRKELIERQIQALNKSIEKGNDPNEKDRRRYLAMRQQYLTALGNAQRNLVQLRTALGNAQHIFGATKAKYDQFKEENKFIERFGSMHNLPTKEATRVDNFAYPLMEDMAKIVEAIIKSAPAARQTQLEAGKFLGLLPARARQVTFKERKAA